MKDPAVSLCSPATRGIWFDLICAMYEARKATLIGTPEALARIGRCTAAQFTAAISELQVTEAADVQNDAERVSVTCRRVSRVLSGRESIKARVAKHRQHVERGDSTVREDVTPLKRECNADVTPASSSSSSDRYKTERGAGGRESGGPQITARPYHDPATLPPDEDGRVLAAMAGWCFTSRGNALSAVHNEDQPIRLAVFSWSQEAPYPGGVVWKDAVVRCINAAQANGTKFGDNPKYAIRVVNGLLAAWRAGTPPEPPATVLGSPARPDDGAAERGMADAMRRIEAKQKARAAK